MNVLAESNFLLEIALEQEDRDACREIVERAEQRQITLLLPAYSVGECLEALGRRKQMRTVVQKTLRSQLHELSPSRPTADTSAQLQALAASMVEGAEEDARRYDAVVGRLLACAEFLPLTAGVIRRARGLPIELGFKTQQDAMVFASVLGRLEAQEEAAECLFITRNRKDFDTRDVRRRLRERPCELKTEFAAANAWLDARHPTGEP